jgi:hypothetical protein
MKNKLMDLHNTLFETLEWITDRDIKGEELAEEAIRARLVVDVAEQVIKNGMLMATMEKLSYDSKFNVPAKLLLE